MNVSDAGGEIATGRHLGTFREILLSTVVDVVVVGVVVWS
jgi:hypothetical protein